MGQNRIEAGDRFIGQDHLRILHHGPGDSDPLLLTSGQLIGPGVGLLTETDAVKLRHCLGHFDSRESIHDRQRRD